MGIEASSSKASGCSASPASMAVASSNCTWAVSYTHLDVYKRQLFHQIQLMVCGVLAARYGKRPETEE